MNHGEFPRIERTGAATKTRMRRWTRIVVTLLVAYIVVAYIVVPFAWKRYERRHALFAHNPRVTQTSDGHPGDPLNVALVGTEDQLQRAMRAAGWYPAAALGFKSDLEIAADTVLSRPDDEAPVSRLFLFGRKEDFAFEQPVGRNPRRRHHVRFWRTETRDSTGRTIWIGSASFDSRVGFSHTTGQVTHHIAADVDAERDHLFHDMRTAQVLADEYVVPDFHTVREGRNGGGDPWHTDGELFVGVIGAL